MKKEHHEYSFTKFGAEKTYNIFKRTNADAIESQNRLRKGSANGTIEVVMGFTKQECAGLVKDKVAELVMQARTEIDFYKTLLEFVEQKPEFFNVGEPVDAFKRCLR